MSTGYVRFWGVRGSYAAPFASHMQIGGNTSCVEIRVGEHVLICDGGTGIIPLGERLIADGTPHNLLVLLTHYHWDHICGLPFSPRRSGATGISRSLAPGKAPATSKNASRTR